MCLMLCVCLDKQNKNNNKVKKIGSGSFKSLLLPPHGFVFLVVSVTSHTSCSICRWFCSQDPMSSTEIAVHRWRRFSCAPDCPRDSCTSTCADALAGRHHPSPVDLYIWCSNNQYGRCCPSPLLRSDCNHDCCYPNSSGFWKKKWKLWKAWKSIELEFAQENGNLN